MGTFTTHHLFPSVYTVGFPIHLSACEGQSADSDEEQMELGISVQVGIALGTIKNNKKVIIRC